MSERIRLDPDRLRELYVVKGMTMKQVATTLYVSYTTVRRNMVFHGIPIRGPGVVQLRTSQSKEWAKYDARIIWLKEGMRLSHSQMGQFLGCSRDAAIHAYHRAAKRRKAEDYVKFLQRTIKEQQ